LQEVRLIMRLRSGGRRRDRDGVDGRSQRRDSGNAGPRRVILKPRATIRPEVASETRRRQTFVPKATPTLRSRSCTDRGNNIAVGETNGQRRKEPQSHGDGAKTRGLVSVDFSESCSPAPSPTAAKSSPRPSPPSSISRSRSPLPAQGRIAVAAATAPVLDQRGSASPPHGSHASHRRDACSPQHAAVSVACGSPSGHAKSVGDGHIQERGRVHAHVQGRGNNGGPTSTQHSRSNSESSCGSSTSMSAASGAASRSEFVALPPPGDGGSSDADDVEVGASAKAPAGDVGDGANVAEAAGVSCSSSYSSEASGDVAQPADGTKGDPPLAQGLPGASAGGDGHARKRRRPEGGNHGTGHSRRRRRREGVHVPKWPPLHGMPPGWPMPPHGAAGSGHYTHYGLPQARSWPAPPLHPGWPCAAPPRPWEAVPQGSLPPRHPGHWHVHPSMHGQYR